MQEQSKKKVRQISVEKTTLTAIAVLVMLAISITSMCYIGWLLWTLPPKK